MNLGGVAREGTHEAWCCGFESARVSCHPYKTFTCRDNQVEEAYEPPLQILAVWNIIIKFLILKKTAIFHSGINLVLCAMDWINVWPIIWVSCICNGDGAGSPCLNKCSEHKHTSYVHVRCMMPLLLMPNMFGTVCISKFSAHFRQVFSGYMLCLY